MDPQVDSVGGGVSGTPEAVAGAVEKKEFQQVSHALQ
jgi:hypothetical protein